MTSSSESVCCKRGVGIGGDPGGQSDSMVPESPLASDAVSEPLREASDMLRLSTRGVVWAGVLAPPPMEPALNWRVRGPGALRRLRLLFLRDLRRRVGGGCITHMSNISQRRALTPFQP